MFLLFSTALLLDWLRLSILSTSISSCNLNSQHELTNSPLLRQRIQWSFPHLLLDCCYLNSPESLVRSGFSEMAQIREAVVSLFIFRRSIQPHSAVAFLVEYLCFVLELLEREKEVAKLFGVICAFDTCVLTFLDVHSKLGCCSHGWGWRRRLSCFWFCRRDEGGDQNQLFLLKFDAFMIGLSMTHFTTSIVSYVFKSPFLVLIPLFLAGIELIPPKAYAVFFTSEELVLQSVDSVEAQSPLQILQFLHFKIDQCQTQIAFLRENMRNFPATSSVSATEIGASDLAVDQDHSISHS